MNKEEMLEALESIQRKMQEAKISEYGAADKPGVLEKAIALKNAAKANIEVITNRLSDDQNYIDTTPRASRYSREERVEVCEKDEEDNKNAIARYEALIEQLENQVFVKQSQKIVDELNVTIAAQGEDLRDSEKMSEEEFQQLRSKYDSNVALRDAHMQNIIENENALTRAEARLNELKGQTENLQKATNEAKEQLEEFDAKQGEILIDEDKKTSDENRLKVLKQNLADSERAEKLAAFEHEKEIAEVIDNYRADKITEAEVIEKVKEIRENTTDEFLTEDIQERDAMNQKNAEAQRICKQEIEKLEAKLSNDENYAVSPFVVERNNRQLKRLNTQIEQIETQTNLYTEQMNKLAEDVNASDELIAEVEKEISRIRIELKLNGREINPEKEKELLAIIESKEADIKYLTTVKYTSLENMEHISTELNNLKYTPRFDRLVELRDRLTESLEKRNGMNMSAKRLDEIELVRLKSDLTALQNSEKYYGLSLYEDFDNLINGKTENTVEPVSNQDKELEDFLDSLDEEPVVEQKMEVGEQTPEFEEPTDDPLNLGDTRKKKFKDLGENEKLAKKAKNKTFIGFLKRWLAPITAFVALILTIAGLKGCSKDVTDKMLKNAQENPNKYENMTDDEIKEDIESQINEDVNHAIEEQQEQAPVEETEVSNEVESKDKMESEVIAPVPVEKPADTLAPAPEMNISLPDVGTEPIQNPNVQSSPDITPSTVVSEPVYDYDINDEKSYGNFTEEPTSTTDDGFVEDPVNPSTPSTDPADDWGEFHEEEIVPPTETPVEAPVETPTDTPEIGSNPVETTSDSLNVTVNNGEKFVVNLGDSTYELNNSDKESNENASSFIELGDTKNLTENEQGAVEIEIAGNTASDLKRDEPLTAEDIQKIRDELASQYGAPTLSQEEIAQANDEYQESIKSR